MKKKLIFISLSVYAGLFYACGISKDFKRDACRRITYLDNQIDSAIIGNFSITDDSLDKKLLDSVNLFTTKIDSLKCKKVRLMGLGFTTLAKQLIWLHQDPRLNDDALGGILSEYAKAKVLFREKICR